MARPKANRRVSPIAATRTGNPAVDRAQDAIVAKLNQLALNPMAQSVPIETTLQAGLNKVPHGMRIPIRNFLWSASGNVTIANRQSGNPHPEREFWCFVSGSDPVTALLFLLPSL